uniref:At4g15545-like C-terminal domain-containing protein n=1 Tax=Kalanchoe fedtschenkoi TaxID=63787 RepID=A0A7N0ZRM0_KALFE
MPTNDPVLPQFDLPEEVLSVLPSDPFEQLDVARKITSIALSTRLSALEDESAFLRAKLDEQDALVAQLQSQIDTLDSSLSDATEKLAQAQLEKENLEKENASLSNTVKKLNRDVAKLEVFRKTLMHSLQEDEEASGGGAQPVPKVLSGANLSPISQDDGTVTPPLRYSLSENKVSDADSTSTEEREASESRPRISHGLLLASQTATPRLTPPGSPPLSGATSPLRTAKPVSPRRHSMSFSTARGSFEDRSSVFSSTPPSTHSSLGSDAGSQAGRTRVDGKEFFRQVRSRLSYEQFGAFLANVKELNAHKQTKEETLRKADEIFGPENKDLYAIFEGLIVRNAS